MTSERAVCELCGAVISTTNGKLQVGFSFLTFERLLNLHMEQQHPNLCVLPDEVSLARAA